MKSPKKTVSFFSHKAHQKKKGWKSPALFSFEHQP